MSYTELEFETATEAGLARLVFVLDTGAEDVGIPPSALIDHEFGDRQDAFRRRVQDSGLTTPVLREPGRAGTAGGTLAARAGRHAPGHWRRERACAGPGAAAG